MRKPVQLNGNIEWGKQPRQQHRFYSIYGGAICCQANSNIETSIMKILEIYEKNTSDMGLQKVMHPHLRQ